MGPSGEDDIGRARDARLELAVSEPPFPEGVPLHLKLDTGMGRFGGAGFPEPPREAVGLMSHLATADMDVDFANLQLERFRAAVEAMPELESHIANSAAALRYPQSRFAAAARCGVALYGLSPFGEFPSSDGLEPVLSWRSSLAQVKRLEAGREHRLRPPLRGRAADVDRSRARRVRGRLPQGSHRDGRCSSPVSDDRSSAPCRWTRSRSSCPRSCPAAPPSRSSATGCSSRSHAARAGTINYEITTGIRSSSERARRVFVDG